MEYDRDDYRTLYNERLIFTKRNGPSLFWEAVGLICFLGFLAALNLLAGCDSHKQDAEIMQMADAKREQLWGMPCMYVCQYTHDHEGCKPAQTRCVKSADLTARSK